MSQDKPVDRDFSKYPMSGPMPLNAWLSSPGGLPDDPDHPQVVRPAQFRPPTPPAPEPETKSVEKESKVPEPARSTRVDTATRINQAINAVRHEREQTAREKAERAKFSGREALERYENARIAEAWASFSNMLKLADEFYAWARRNHPPMRRYSFLRWGWILLCHSYSVEKPHDPDARGPNNPTNYRAILVMTGSGSLYSTHSRENFKQSFVRFKPETCRYSLEPGDITHMYKGIARIVLDSGKEWP